MGPPPIRPASPIQRHEGRTSPAYDAEALGGVVQGEADDQDGRQADRPGPRRDPDRESLGEVVNADRGGDREPGAQRAAAREVDLVTERVGLRQAQRGHVGTARDRGRAAAGRTDPALERGEAGAPGRETATEQHDQPDQVGHRLVVVLDRVQGRVDDLHPVREHIYEDEREHADREHRQRHPRASAEQLQAPDRKAEVDRQPGQRS